MRPSRGDLVPRLSVEAGSGVTDQLDVSFAKACARVWGRQVWRIWLGMDGWPAKTLLGRIMEEGLTGAGHTRARAWYPEGLTEEGLLVSRALHRLEEPDRRALMIHYAVPLPADRKARVVGIAERTYYRSVGEATRRLAVALSTLDNAGSPNVYSVQFG